ncbi:D-glycerate dehydrogenase [Sporosarcina sp. P21c]|uniref:2-hydroxyacid dehydrogenase n=1 Tax=unclassified Sporosarcina TaxID=2647733 RepID=UPI000C171ADC|nr:MULTISPECIES: D-glycerate dehydrogenase [unclassified Sporosarcina]PIC66853.1 D-glycerate dehydrogenase [Sporosarcina sp. P16a]PIC89271.1 D-glycerate dehydrogenase [Sporosarcina sp. P21c]PIC91559.1 D-glycerate dehydrogenase [Sporosarcina sp. P25]
MKPTVYICRGMPEEMIAPVREYYEVRMWESTSEAVPRDVLLKEVADANALWTVISDQIDEEVLNAAPSLQLIVNMAVGYNHIDVKAAAARNITVTNTPDVLTETTADLAFALLMATARDLIGAENMLREGRWTSWEPLGFTGMDVNGATLGIVGMGRIGEAVMKRAKGFDMDVLYHNRNRKSEMEDMYGCRYAGLPDLLASSDFVLILVPFSEETKGMIGEKQLSQMKETGILINVARGGIVDEDALFDALRTKKIHAAGLDVFETEPVPLDHPLLTLPNVTVLPHIGSATVKTRKAMMKLNVDALLAFAQGEEPNHQVRG